MKLPHLARSYVKDENLAVKLFFWRKVVSTFSYYGSKKIIFNLLICSFVNTHSLNSFYFLSPRKVIRARVISIFFETVAENIFHGFLSFSRHALSRPWRGNGFHQMELVWSNNFVTLVISLCSTPTSQELEWLYLSLSVSQSVCHR